MNKLANKIFRKEPRPSEKDVKYLDFAFLQYPFIGSTAYRLVDNNDEDNDRETVNTVSTNATAANIPGTGRIIDMYIYQFLGRKIERFANRFSMSRLPPARIVQCLGGRVSFLLFYPITTSISDIIEQIHEYPEHPGGGGVEVAGLKSLVRQTQSDSIYRSAAALTALVHLATSDSKYADFLFSASESEPLFHLESLAQELSELNSTKQYLSLLTCLVRQWPSLTLYNPPPITLPEADQYWPRLIELLDLYRAQFQGNDPHYTSPEYDLLEILRNGCILYSQCTCLVRGHQHFGIPLYKTECVVDIPYFLTIFLVRCIALQYQQLAKAGDAAHLPRMVLFACSRWIQACSSEYIYGMHENMRSFRRECKLASVGHVLTQYGYFTSDEYVFQQRNAALPRKIRLEAEYPAIVRQHVQAWIPRTRRLLLSFDELDREARDIALLTRFAPSSERHWETYSHEKSGRSRERARQHLARHMGISEDDIKSLMKSRAQGRFMDIRDGAGRVYAVEGDLNMEFVESLININIFQWHQYKLRCRRRHEWGEYLRSNLEWDWDVASCLKRLFKQPRSQAPRLGGLQATIISDESGETKLDVTIDGAHAGPPKMVEVKYKTAEGEVKYAQYALNPVVKNIDVDADAKANPGPSEEGHVKPTPTATSVTAAVEGPHNVVAVETIDVELKDPKDESKRLLESRGDGRMVPEALQVDLGSSYDEDLEQK